MLKEFYAIDIETVSQGSRADAFTEGVTIKTGNTKDEEKLKVKIEEGRAKARASHGLSWITGKVFCVSVINCETLDKVTFIGFEESDVLKKLSDHLKTIPDTSRLFAKSGKDFDYPFLTGRYMANQIPVPPLLMSTRFNGLNDVDDLLTYSKQSGQRGRLSDYAHGLMIDGKTMHGSQMQDEYNRAMLADKESQATILGDIIKYCEQDTLIVAEFVRRYYGYTGN